ncbi:MAG: hypothetical protein M1813_007773 [Trichoglossum hirsutum]|nr:MAG: hypothetical protein M1813_007773 [Trichoglossum hirsutum]
MEVLAIVGLVSNIVQFVDFGCKLTSKSVELYQSSSGMLAENIDAEAATNHLVILNDKIKDGAVAADNGALKDLCISCGATAAELLAVLGKVKVQGKHTKWKSMREALRSVWSKEEVEGLERRLLSLRDELNLHVVVDIKEQVRQFKKEQSDRLEDLESTARRIVDAIDGQQDIFVAAHQMQLTLMRDLHRETATIASALKETGAEITKAREQGMSSAEQDRYLSMLPSVDGAAFNSRRGGNDHPKCPERLECIPGTRVDILQQIMEWSKSSSGPSTFWLSGMAGTGKSTIARGGDLSHAGKFIISIAVQLAHRSPSHKRCVSEALAEHGDIATQILRDQWNHLILQPPSNLEASVQSPLVFVVDALDECENKSDIRAILRLLAEAQTPETPIRHGFCHIQKDEHEDFVLHEISPPTVDHDISIFLRDSLGTTGRELALGNGWPGEQSIELLVYSAGGLFIWAATACRFIREGKRFARKRLDLILQDGTSTRGPGEKLNEIYMSILRNSIDSEYDDQEKEESYRTIKLSVGAVVILFSPLSVVSLAGLLPISEGDIGQTLDDLHSILEVPVDRHYPIRLHHPSFRDFLLNKKRCRDRHFWVDEMEAHGVLAEGCLQLMSDSLKRDMCDLQTPGVLSDSVESSQVEQCLPVGLQYACRYWVQHLQQSKALLFDNGQVHVFLQKHMLHWLEALSLIGKIFDSVKMVTDLQSMVS